MVSSSSEARYDSVLDQWMSNVRSFSLYQQVLKPWSFCHAHMLGLSCVLSLVGMDLIDAWIVPERYAGDTNLSGQRHGEGTLYCTNGDIYMGHWQDGQRYGIGAQIYAWKLEKFEGEWVNDQWHGNGRLTRVDGSFIEGTFKEGRLHGVCKLITADGVTVESAWMEGKMFTGDVRIIWPATEDGQEPLK